MALRKLESFGWLTGAPSTWLPLRWNAVSGTGYNISTPGRRASTNCLNFTSGADQVGHIFDSQSVWIVHTAVKLANAARIICQWFDGGTIQTSVQYNNATQRIVLYRGVSTIVATSTGSLVPAGIWHHLIIALTIHNSAGACEIRLNGETIMSVSGLDNANTVNNYANQLGFVGHSYHDIAICDGMGAAPYNGILGDVRVNCLIPNAAGASSAWTPSAGANYQNVDDATPDSDTTYNATLTAGAIDSYIVPDPTLTGMCRGVAVAALVRKDDAGTRTLRPILHDAGVPANYQGTTRNLADSYLFHEDVWQVHPGTGADFTQTQLNNAQPGVQLVS